jgi:hypothetical protein
VARIAEALPVYCRSDNPERRPRSYFTKPLQVYRHPGRISQIYPVNSRSSNLSIQRSLIYRQVGVTEWLVMFKIVPMSILPAQKNEGYLDGYLRSRWL